MGFCESLPTRRKTLQSVYEKESQRRKILILRLFKFACIESKHEDPTALSRRFRGNGSRCLSRERSHVGKSRQRPTSCESKIQTRQSSSFVYDHESFHRIREKLRLLQQEVYLERFPRSLYQYRRRFGFDPFLQRVPIHPEI